MKNPNGWRDVSTLPKYKTRILVTHLPLAGGRPFVVSAWWDAKRKVISTDLGVCIRLGGYGSERIIGWLPIPEPMEVEA